MHRASSVVLNVVPVLPQHPKPKGKITNYSPLFSRSPIQPQHVNAFKVSPSTVSHLTHVCRYDLDMAALMPGSVDLPVMF